MREGEPAWPCPNCCMGNCSHNATDKVFVLFRTHRTQRRDFLSLPPSLPLLGTAEIGREEKEEEKNKKR